MVSGLKFIIVAAIIISCVIYYPVLTPQNITAFINANSVSAPIIFIAICTVRPVLFFLPSMGLTIVAGILFGALYGTIYVSAGGALSTIVGFYFARWIGRDVVRKLVKKNNLLQDIERNSMVHGRNAVLYMRIFNLPWDIVSYWAGVSGIGFKDFYTASLIPLVPVSFLYTYFGSRINTPGSYGFIVSLAIMIVMGAVPYMNSRWKKRPHE